MRNRAQHFKVRIADLYTKSLYTKSAYKKCVYFDGYSQGHMRNRAQHFPSKNSGFVYQILVYRICV